MEPLAPPTVGFTVRQYQPADRDAVRDLCCATGFLGNPIDPVFEDRDLFASFLTDYYLECEPDSAFVLTVEDAIKGYLIGCRFPQRYRRFSVYQSVSLAAKALWRYPGYRPESKRYLHWILFKAWCEVPEAPRHIGHFHINFLPEIKRIAVFRAVMETYFRFLRKEGVDRISAQMVTFGDRRTLPLFERYGFKVLNRTRVTKFERYSDQSIYLCTLIKDLVEKDGWVLHQVQPGDEREDGRQPRVNTD
jgi:hypothetical protein